MDALQRRLIDATNLPANLFAGRPDGLPSMGFDHAAQERDRSEWFWGQFRPNPALMCRCTRTPPVSCEAHRGTLRQRQHAPVLERNEAGDATECIVCGEPGRTAAPGFAPMCETCEGTI